MSRWVTASLLVLGILAIAAGRVSLYATESIAEVICHGKLRCGMVAVGGETTGTNLSLGGFSWELLISDPQLKDFAEANHHKLVTATGTLQYLNTPERPGRWVVSVNSLTARDPKIKEDAVAITVRGTVEKTKSTLKLKTDDFTLTITPPDNAKLLKKLDSLESRTVILKGQVDLPKSRSTAKTLKITPTEVVAN
ncbi:MULTISPECIES: hypothetical protein [unclassified Schlesneria]|uniref:hypothetical protein n=1 Tax=Schlesneria TaxID=656899 RepID=UPI002F0F1980